MTPDVEQRIGEETALLRAFLALARRNDHDAATMLANIPQQPAAAGQSLVETQRCDYCQATPGEDCRPDCSSHFDR